MAEIKWRSEREGRTGRYRGVAIEVVRWRSLNSDGTPYDPTGPYAGNEWTWNYYLYIPRNMLPERVRSEFETTPEALSIGRTMHRPYPAILEGLDWHGGMTLYEIEGRDGMPVCYKAGCDYNHYWDEGQRYSTEAVAFDARRTVDDLWEAIPDMLMRCSWDGRFVPATEGAFNEHGDFESTEGAKARAEHRAERAARVAANG